MQLFMYIIVATSIKNFSNTFTFRSTTNVFIMYRIFPHEGILISKFIIFNIIVHGLLQTKFDYNLNNFTTFFSVLDQLGSFIRFQFNLNCCDLIVQLFQCNFKICQDEVSDKDFSLIRYRDIINQHRNMKWSLGMYIQHEQITKVNAIITDVLVWICNRYFFHSLLFSWDKTFNQLPLWITFAFSTVLFLMVLNKSCNIAGKTLLFHCPL